MKLIHLLIWQLTALAGVCLVAGCGDDTLAGKWEYKEVNRFKSPDSQIEAVLVEGDAGATTSTVTSIYLVQTGGKRPSDERINPAVFAADHIKGLKITWKQPKLLQVQYDEARILAFKNFWYSAEAQNFRYVVEIRLEPTASEFSLPLRDRQWW
ncbi:MAG: hypothetical protein M9920_00470 [Verrucomicrobiae bacterium]|nr:hypothetical protein [Verrucomicrobiae bacterium]